MTAHREQIEELLELCWTADEDKLGPLNRDHLPMQLRCFLPHPIEPNGDVQQATIDLMTQHQLLLAEGRTIQLSPEGRRLAAIVVRRHRLTEVLFHAVITVSEEAMEATACQVEHILNAEVTDAVCAFLGHPPSCPHGRLIPKGPCCERAARVVEPLIIPLRRLAVGEEATVLFVHTTRHDYLQRLSAFGVGPGRVLRLRQTQPALVIQLGETELALEPQFADEIFVKRQPSRLARNAESEGFRLKRRPPS